VGSQRCCRGGPAIPPASRKAQKPKRQEAESRETETLKGRKAEKPKGRKPKSRAAAAVVDAHRPSPCAAVRAHRLCPCPPAAQMRGGAGAAAVRLGGTRRLLEHASCALALALVDCRSGQSAGRPRGSVYRTAASRRCSMLPGAASRTSGSLGLWVAAVGEVACCKSGQGVES
jgi:hypothetical protein